MSSNNVKVTTTSGFDGVQIVDYYKPITAHIVVGMNFFKDFLSGFSDFFGGKSSSYQNTLSSMNQEVINQLKNKAYAKGANCVLSLKIDNDEISAQGKSMMMVTAIGTPAKGIFSTKTINQTQEGKLDRISIDHFNFFKQKHKYIQASKEQKPIINTEFWEFVRTNRIHELADFILDRYLRLLDPEQLPFQEKIKTFENNLYDYFSIIDPAIGISTLYKKSLNESDSNKKAKILDLIHKLHLIDFDQIITLLKEGQFEAQKLAIQILKGDKQSYDKDDLRKMDELINIISTSFPERGQYSKKKKGLTGKEKEIWICECKKENPVEKTYCSNCGSDIFGFQEVEESPMSIAQKLIFDIEILNDNLK